MWLWKRLLIVSLGAAAICSAQVNRATLTGIVTDPSGAVVPSVKVVATHVETGTSVATNTTSAGAYTIPALQIGNYKVEYEAAGFKKSVNRSRPRRFIRSKMSFPVRILTPWSLASFTASRVPGFSVARTS